MSGKGAGLFGHLVLERLIKESHETAVEKAKAKLATACYVVLMAVILGGMVRCVDAGSADTCVCVRACVRVCVRGVRVCHVVCCNRLHSAHWLRRSGC